MSTIRVYQSYAALQATPPAPGETYLLYAEEYVGGLELYWRVCIAGRGTVALCFEESLARQCAKGVQGGTPETEPVAIAPVSADVFTRILHVRGIVTRTGNKDSG